MPSNPNFQTFNLPSKNIFLTLTKALLAVTRITRGTASYFHITGVEITMAFTLAIGSINSSVTT